MTSKRTAALVAAVALVVGMVASFVALTGPAAAERPGPDEPCVPSEAWTEHLEHPAETHEETITVTDEEAWTETIPGTPDQWWNWSPNHQSGPFDGPPSFPEDPRGTWQGPHDNGGPSPELYGTFQQGNGHGSWFHREQGAPEQTVEHPAVTHEETITVTDREAWTETIEHLAVECPSTEDPTDPPTTEDPTDPTDPPSLIPPTSTTSEPPSTEQRCSPARCVRLTLEDGEVVDREVIAYPADRIEEGM